MADRKNKTKIFLGLLMLLLISGSLNPTPARTAQTPEQAATRFYKWYLQELNLQRDPRTERKTKLLGQLSRRLGKWLYSIPDGEYGADYFIDAQDWDEEWADSITASRARIKGNEAQLSITLGVHKNGRQSAGIGKHVLRLKMVKEGGQWKIDRINDN